MALKVGELYASFGIDQSALDGAMKSIEEKCNKVAASLAKVGTGLTLAVTTPILKVAKNIIDITGNFEESSNKVETIADTTVMSMDEINTQILALSSSTGQAATDLNEALYQTISATGDTANAMSYVEIANKAAVGGFTDQATAVDGLTTVLNAYGLKGEDAIQKVSDQMLVAQNYGKTTFGELASSMGQVIPVAASLDVSYTELFSSVAALTKQGIGTSEAVTGMKAALSNVIKPSSEASKVAKQLGLDFSATALQSKGLGGFLQDVMDKTGGNVETLSLLFGSVEGLNSILALTSEQGMADYIGAMDAMEDSAGATDAAYEKMTRGIKYNLQKMGTAFTNLGISIGLTQSDALVGLANKVTSLVEKFTLLDDASKETILKVAGLAAAAGPAMVGLAGIVKVAGHLLPILSALISPMGIVAGGLALMAVAAVDANNDIGKAFESISKTAKVKLQTVTKTLMAQIKTISSRMPALTSSIVNGIKDVLPQITSTAVQIVSGLMDTISENADEILSIGTTIITSITDGLSESLPGLISSGAEIVTSIASALIKAVPSIISAAGTLATALWNGIKNTDWVTLGKQIIDAIGTSASGVWSLFKGWFEEAKTAVQNIDWATVWETIQSKFGDVKAWFTEKWTQAKEAVQNIDWATLGSNILNTIKVTKDALVSKAKEIINGLAEKLGDPDVTSTIQSITGVAATIAGKIITSKADWLGTATNFISKLIEQLVDSGFLSSAITTAADTLGSIVVAIANAIGDNASTIVSCAADLMTELLKGLSDSDALSTILSSAADAVIAIANAIAENADEIATSALDLALKLVEGLASLDWYTISNSLAAALGNLINAIVTWFSKPENVDRLKKAGIAIADGIFSGVTDGKLRVSEIANELVGSSFDRSALDVTKAIDSGRYFADSWTDSWMTTLTQGISDGSLTADQQLAMAVALMGQGFGDQIKELSPSIYDSANGMFNSVYRAVNDGNIIANFANIGYRITDELALAISDNQINVEDATRALSVGMSDEMILSMSQSELRTYLNQYFTDTSAEITNLLKDSATNWGKVFGQAIPDGATVGLENGMYVLRSKTGEVIKLVSSVDAQTEVEKGNKDTAKAGVDAMSGGISDGETAVSDASTKVAAAAVSPFEGLPDETKAQAALMMTAINEAIAAGSPEATAAVEVAAQAVSDKASEILNGDTGKAVGEAYVGGIDTGITNKKSTVETTMNTVANAIKTKATSILTSLAGSSIGRNFATGISSALSAMQSTLTNAASTIANAARNSASGTLTHSSGSSIGYNFSLGIASGIRNGISAITAAASAAAQAALTAAKRKLGINSPSTVAEDEVGAMFDAGGANGILGNMGLLIDAAKTAGTAMLDSFYVSDPSRGTAYESTGSRNATGTGSGQGTEPTQAALDPVAVGTAMADRLIETGALQGDVYMDKDKVGVKTSAASSKEIQRQAKSGWKGRTAGTVLGI